MEEWKDAPGIESKYEISNQGRLRNKSTGVIRKNVDNGRGYFKFPVMVNRKNTSYYIHRLVAMAFVPNPQSLDTVNHIDGNKQNNNADNLEWCSQKENVHHVIKTGIFDPVTNYIFDAEAVRFIRNNYKPRCKEFGMKALAAKFNCNPKTIRFVVDNKTYKEIL